MDFGMTESYPKMREIECVDCGVVLIEMSSMSCHDTNYEDAIWDDSRKSWVCKYCADKIPYLKLLD